MPLSNLLFFLQRKKVTLWDHNVVGFGCACAQCNPWNCWLIFTKSNTNVMPLKTTQQCPFNSLQSVLARQTCKHIMQVGQ